MSIVWRYYLGIAVGFIVVAMWLLTRLPIFLVFRGMAILRAIALPKLQSTVQTEPA
jgi:hypothetical protein